MFPSSYHSELIIINILEWGQKSLKQFYLLHPGLVSCSQNSSSANNRLELNSRLPDDEKAQLAGRSISPSHITNKLWSARGEVPSLFCFFLPSPSPPKPSLTLKTEHGANPRSQGELTGFQTTIFTSEANSLLLPYGAQGKAVHTDLFALLSLCRQVETVLPKFKQKTEVSSLSSHRKSTGDAQEDWGLCLLCRHGGRLFGAYGLQLLKCTKWTWTPMLF